MLTIILAVVAYLLILGGITYFSSKRETASDFLIYSRKLGWKWLGISLFASILSGYNLVLLITFAYLFGIYTILIFLGAALAFIALYFLIKKIKPIIIKKNMLTVVDYFFWKYGTKTGQVVNFYFIIILLLFIISQMYVNTLLMANLFSMDKYLAAFIINGIVFLYIYFGGFKTEIRTDVFQGILMFILLGMVFLTDFDYISGQNIITNLMDQKVLFGAFVIMIVQFLTLFIQPEVWQKVLSAKSLPDLRKGLVFSFSLVILLVVPIVLVGLNAKFGNLISDPGNGFYEILSTSAPQYYFPLVVVALIAAFMSTLDSSLFAVSVQIAKRFPGFKAKTDEAVKRKTKLSMIIIFCIALLSSLFLSSFLTVVFQLVSLMSVIASILIFAYILKSRKTEVFIALIVGLIAFIYATFFGLITEDPVTTMYPIIFIVGYLFVQKLIVFSFSKFAFKVIK